MKALDMALDRTHAIDKLGGPVAVAKALGISAPSVTNWRHRGVPIERCVDLERLSGGTVRRWHLRPEDWHAIWPELISAPGAPKVPRKKVVA